MNWYRFKIELAAWLYKVVACVVSSLVVLLAGFVPEGTDRSYPMAMQTLAENEWTISTALAVGVAALWLCYWKIFSFYRGRRSYGER